MEIAQAKRMHAMVWQVRDELGDKWPTPNTEDSLAYADTEIGEAIDTDLRLRRPLDARNNRRNGSVYHELAQAAMMLLTAFGPELEDGLFPANADAWSLASINLDVAVALVACQNGDETWAYNAAYALSAIDIYCIGVEQYLREVLDETLEKWG